MIKKYIYIMLFVGLIALSAEIAYAFTISVDGQLNEWGVTPDVYDSSVWTPNSGIFHSVEDHKPGTESGRVWPGWGGQLYDAEAIYLTYDSTNLYYAVVTGFPAGGTTNADGTTLYVTGDIAFDFGINDTYEYGISTIDRNGLFAGNLYKVDDWNTGICYQGPSDPTYIDTTNKAPELKSSDGSLIYSDYYYDKGEHYVIEGYVPHTAFSSDWYYGNDVRMHWTMSCGNDYLNVDANITPEPVTTALLGLGFLGFGIVRRKRKK